MDHDADPSAAPRARELGWGALSVVALALCWLVFGGKPWESGLAAAREASIEPRTGHYLVSGLWGAAWAWLGIGGLGWVLRRWLGRPLTAEIGDRSASWAGDEREKGGPVGWLLLASTLAAMVLLAQHAVPRLGHGLWHDEGKGVRNFVVGRYQMKKDGSIAYRPVTWAEAAWDFRFPNHIFHGLLAKASHTLWPPAEKWGGTSYVNERALRLPSLIGGLGGLAAAAWMLAVAGFRRAALIAPWLLAAHPWYLRYAAEARGYSLLFLLGPVCVGIALLAVRRGSWGWWVALGGCQFLLVWTVLNSLYLALVINAAVGVWLLARRREASTPVLARRWAVSVAVSALCCLPAFLPVLPQFALYVEDTGGDVGKYDKDMVRDMASAYTAGMRYQEWGGGGGGHLRRNAAGTVAAALSALAAAAGAVALWRRGLSGRLLAGVLLLPAPLFFLHCTISKPHIFYWYSIFGLPLFWGVAAIGCARAGEWMRGRWGGAFLAAVPAALVLLGLAVGGAEKRRFLREHPIEAERESVLAARGSFVDPQSPAFREVTMLGFCREPVFYDVSSVRATDREAFLAELRRADSEGKPLFVNYGPYKSYQHFADIMEVVDDPAVFELVAEFEGVDEGSDRTVKRYLTGGAGRARRR